MASKAKKTTLADKINSLITATPNFGSDDELDNTNAKVVERFDDSDSSDGDFRQSKIRKQNVDLLDQLDKRYEGKKVSRKDIFGENSNDNVSNNLESNDSDEYSTDSDEDNDRSNKDKLKTEEDSSEDDMSDNVNESDSEEQSDNLDEESFSEDESEYEDEDKDTDEKEDEDDCDISKYQNQKTDNSFKTMSDVNIKADIEKGNCVRNQLKVFENLLEVRIKLQKCLVTSNQMPQYDMHKVYRSDTDFTKKTKETKNTLTTILDKMLELQCALLKQYSETKKLGVPNNKRKLDEEEDDDVENDSMNEEIPSDTEDEMGNEENEEEETKSDEGGAKPIKKNQRKKMKFSDYEKVLKERHDSYADYRNSVIQKWNDKTRIASGATNKGTNQTALKQIEFALNDKSKLRKKTQLKRSEYVIVGKPVIDEANDDGRRVQEYDTEIYDDDDFYHQLLRDLIEHKSSDVTDPIQLSKQWIQLQNMRRKMKRKIDTRATKGRRVRYDVHNKLVNFMAPITAYDTWTDHAKTELYNSLFGKIKAAGESY